MGCPKIVRCAACLLVSYRPLGTYDESTQKKMEGSDGGKEETKKAEGDEAASASAPAPAPAAPAPS